MDIQKKARFRIQLLDLQTKKSKVITVYANGENLTLEQFKEKIIKSIKGDKR